MDLMFILFISLGGVIGGAAILYWFIARKLQYWKRECPKVPFVEPEFFYGNVRGVGSDVPVSEFIKQTYLLLKPQGPAGGFYVYCEPSLMITDLDLVKQILVKNFDIFPNRGRYFNKRDDPLSANLLNLEDDAWKHLRQKLAHTFTPAKIKIMFDLVSQKADKLVETIANEIGESQSAMETKIVCARYTTDVIASAAFGIESSTLEEGSNRFLEIGLKVMHPSSFLKRIFMNKFKNLSRKMGLASISREVSSFYIDVVRKTIQGRKETPQVKRNDFMSVLLKLQDPSVGNSLTFNQVAAQCFIFFSAGFETGAIALTCCLYELSQNKEIQEKARESVRQAMENHGNVPTYDAVKEMGYLQQCIDETLRKYPPTTALLRIAKEDYRIPGSEIVIKKGTWINIPVYGIHRDPEIYPEPEVFDPDRFSKEETSSRHDFAFLPFGVGPRECIGKRFAIVEIKLALAKILTSYTFELDRSRTSVPMKIEPKRIMLMSPAEDICIKFYEL